VEGPAGQPRDRDHSRHPAPEILWPAEEWECRNNIMLLNKAAVKWNKAQLKAGNKDPYDPKRRRASGRGPHRGDRPAGSDPGAEAAEEVEVAGHGKSYIEAVLVANQLVDPEVAKRILRKHKNERGEEEEIHYYYLGEVAHSWDLYYTDCA